MSAVGPVQPPPRPLDPGERRVALVSLVRSMLVATTVVVGYFVLPLSLHLTTGPLLKMLAGLAGVGALLVWQIRAIVRSPFPGVRAVGALVVTVTLFLSVFASTYYLMSETASSTFSEPLTRLDAMYFTVTVFATVGFGDITAVSAGARAIATVQMVGDLVLVGLIARAIVDAVNQGRSRLGAERSR